MLVTHLWVWLPDEGIDRSWFGVGDSNLGDGTGNQIWEKAYLPKGVLVVVLHFHAYCIVEWLGSDR